MYKKLILAIPHSVRQYYSTWDNKNIADQDADLWTDWHTDILYTPPYLNLGLPAMPGWSKPLANIERMSAIVGSISRFDCDLERLENDPLSASGQGIIYTKSPSGAIRIASHISNAELMEEWRNYRAKLVNELIDGSMIIDCHSFPSFLSDVDICIGYNEDETKPSEAALAAVKDYFGNLGYFVSINKPYANAISPESDKKYSSMMIEANKALYLDETTFKLKSCAYKLHYDLMRLYDLLLGAGNDF